MEPRRTPLRIAQIASVCFSVPPKSHGGTELVIDGLVRGLGARGHDVTLFASGDSTSPADRLHSVAARATQDDPSSTAYLERELEVRNVEEAYARADDFDLLHAHWPTPAPYFSGRTRRPTLLTLAYVEKHLFDYYRRRFPNLHYACVSRAQAAALGADLPVVHNGIDTSTVPFGERPEEFLLTVGRIVPHKGADVAIRVARRAGLPLVIVGDVTPYLRESAGFYEEKVAPFVDGDRVKHFRHLPNSEVLALAARAKAFLFPISWEEPFGLVVAEAMAAGTPVVATPRGSMPELVEPGVTGLLAETEEDLAAAVRRIGDVDRARCRERAIERFDVGRMTLEYERLYERILGRTRPTRAGGPRAATYEPAWIRERSLAQNPLRQAESLLEVIPLSEGMRVLDLGCGKAASSIFLAREIGVEVWAVDKATPPADNQARAREAGCGTKVVALRADARDLPFAPESFDAAIAIDSFHYYGTDERWLATLVRFVRPGGWIGVADIGLAREIERPDDVPSFLRADFARHWSFVHSPEHWKRMWERTGLVRIVCAEAIVDSEEILAEYVRDKEPTGGDAITRAVRADEEGFIRLFRLVARKV